MSAWKFFFNYFAILFVVIGAALLSMATFHIHEWPRALGMFVAILGLYYCGYIHGRANALGK